MARPTGRGRRQLMGIMLGNLSLTQMQKRLGIELSADDIMRFPHRQENVSQKLGEYTWHCFDIPFLIECDSEDTAKSVLGILRPYASKMQGQIQIAWQDAAQAGEGGQDGD